MKKNRIISISFIISIIFLVLSCKSGKKANEEKKENIPEDIVEMRDDQIKLANIEIGQIEMHSLSGTLKVNGIVAVSPQGLANVCAPMGGYIKTTTLMQGNAVTKGQTLAIIENQEFINIQQSFLEAKIKLEYAEAEYKRHSELYKDDVYSEKNLQQVTADYKTLKTQVKALEQKLALIGINPVNLNENTISRSIVLTSPITGYIKAVNVNIGKFVSPSDVLFEIVNKDKLFLELMLFEKDADKVVENQKIRFFINNEQEQHQAVVSHTSKSVNADKTYKVFANVTDMCKNIMPGMFVYAVIESGGNKVTSLPSEAIVSFNDKDYIFIFDKNKLENGKAFTEYKMIQVHKGVTDNGFTEVILPTGFNINTAKIVVKGAYNLLSAKKNAGEMSCG